ncbi:MAG: hypothetical protein QF755_06005 [Candidatus Peribacteraceae bacterium]|jgi:hypothetical protein|nr:hypothetical protein [Candidatus Peribacteraceae bacterium]
MESKRAIILRFTNESAHAAIEQLMEQIPFEFSASIGDKKCEYSKVSSENQPWFNSSDIRGGHYEGLDLNQLLPLDEELIDAMRPTEAVFMNLVTRLEYAREFTYDERKRMYYLHLRLWNDFIEKNKINVAIFGIMPHEIPDYVIYGLCKIKKIPTLILHSTTLEDCAFLVEDWEESAVQVKDRYQELQSQEAQVTLGEYFENYYQGQVNPQGKKPITFKRPNAVQRAVKGGFIRSIPTLFSFKAWARRISKLKTELYRKKLARIYDGFAVEPDYSQKYIYVPLHFQPECSTCPMAGAYDDQKLMVQMLSSCAPEGVMLYVKEHPRQRAKGIAYRNEAYYQDLAKLKNVRFVKIDTGSFELREHCSAVVTGTGTAGFEALFREKPVMMFGHRFYQYAPGVFQIRTKEDCKNAMSAIFEGGEKPELKKIRLYLKAIQDTCVRAAVCDWHRKQASNLSHEANTKAISEALVKRMQSARV